MQWLRTKFRSSSCKCSSDSGRNRSDKMIGLLIKQLWDDIQDVIGPRENWPRDICCQFWKSQPSPAWRRYLCAFVFVNGLNPAVYAEWLELMKMPKYYIVEMKWMLDRFESFEIHHTHKLYSYNVSARQYQYINGTVHPRSNMKDHYREENIYKRGLFPCNKTPVEVHIKPVPMPVKVIRITDHSDVVPTRNDTCPPKEAKKNTKKEKKRKTAINDRKKAKKSKLKMRNKRSKPFREAIADQLRAQAENSWIDALFQSAPQPQPKKTRVSGAITTLVYIYIETTSRDIDSDLIQISAVHDQGHFNQYLIPIKKVTQRATAATALACTDGQLYYQGLSLQADNQLQGHINFITFLQKLENPVLVAHGGVHFDFKMLQSSFDRCSLWRKFQATCHGLVDTADLCKKLLPKVKCYQPNVLAREIQGVDYSCQNAMDHCTRLKSLVEFIMDSTGCEDMLEHSFTYEYITDNIVYAANTKLNLPTYVQAVDRGFISKHVAKKLAGSGLAVGHLKTVYKKLGLESLVAILSETDRFNQKLINKPQTVAEKLAHFLALN